MSSSEEGKRDVINLHNENVKSLSRGSANSSYSIPANDFRNVTTFPKGPRYSLIPKEVGKSNFLKQRIIELLEQSKFKLQQLLAELYH